jgi:uncharacterized protein YjiS (DUF1127 family)
MQHVAFCDVVKPLRTDMTDMTMTTLAQPLSGLANLKRALARYRLMTQTKNALQALSDRELFDIGITRGMIRSIAMEHAITVNP